MTGRVHTTRMLLDKFFLQTAVWPNVSGKYKPLLTTLFLSFVVSLHTVSKDIQLQYDEFNYTSFFFLTKHRKIT